MSRGEYRLLRTVQGCTAFAKVVLDAYPVDENGRFEVDTSSIEEQWREAVAFGVLCAHERLMREGDRRTVRVVVESLQASNVDTNVMAVAFASFHAACVAFGMEPDDRVRLRDDGTYELPAFMGPGR